MNTTAHQVFNNIVNTLNSYASPTFFIKLNYAGNRETVDEFDNEEEAVRMLKEYSLNADQYSFYYITKK